MNQDLDEYESLGIKVLVISPDSLYRTKEFFKDAQFEPAFTTLLDPQRSVLKKYYTVMNEGRINPSLFLIDKKGRLRFKYIAQHMGDRPSKKHILEAIKMMQTQDKE